MMKQIGGIIFICAAIDIQLKIFVGKRHHEIFKQLKEKGYTKEEIAHSRQGFLIGEDGVVKFISRDKATEIAKAYQYPMIGSILTSEDLW